MTGEVTEIEVVIEEGVEAEAVVEDTEEIEAEIVLEKEAVKVDAIVIKVKSDSYVEK